MRSCSTSAAISERPRAIALSWLSVCTHAGWGVQERMDGRAQERREREGGAVQACVLHACMGCARMGFGGARARSLRRRMCACACMCVMRTHVRLRASSRATTRLPTAKPQGQLPARTPCAQPHSSPGTQARQQPGRPALPHPPAPTTGGRRRSAPHRAAAHPRQPSAPPSPPPHPGHAGTGRLTQRPRPPPRGRSSRSRRSRAPRPPPRPSPPGRRRTTPAWLRLRLCAGGRQQPDVHPKANKCPSSKSTACSTGSTRARCGSW